MPTSSPSFPQETAWSTILGASDRGAPDWKDHFERLVARYWRPVHAYLVRRWKCPSEDALDLTQEFFAHLLETNALQGADPDRGRFRTFLKLQLRNLVVDDLRRRKAAKRGGEARLVPLSDDGAVAAGAAGDLSPEEQFDRDWARCVLGTAVRQLREILAAAGKEKSFEAFRYCVLESPIKSYAECAQALDIKESDVRNFVFRARRELVRIVRDLIRDSMENAAGLDEEFQYILGLFERRP